MFDTKEQVLSVDSRVKLTWETGETNTGTVVKVLDSSVVVVVDSEPGEEYEYEKFGSEFYEINNSQERLEIVRI